MRGKKQLVLSLDERRTKYSAVVREIQVHLLRKRSLDLVSIDLLEHSIGIDESN